jgi:hypothetical protein
MLLGRVWCSFKISGNRPRLQSHHKSDLSRDGGDAGLCAGKERFHVSLS